MKGLVKKLLQFDFETALCSCWGNISPFSKRVFLWVFGLFNFVFFWPTISFIPDNHSLGTIKSGMLPNFQFFSARFGGLLQQLVGGDIFPIFNNVICYTGLVLTVIYLAHYWRVPKTFLCYTLFCLFIILMPYVLPWVYFIRHQTYFWNLFLIMYALTLLQKPKLLNVMIASFLFFICIGTYLAMIHFIFIVVLGRCIQDVLFDKATFATLWKNYYKPGIALLVGGLAYICVFFYMKYSGSLMAYATVPIFSLEKIRDVFSCFKENIPYLSSFYRFTLLSLIFCFFVYFIWKKDWLILFLFLIVLLSTQMITLFSQDKFLYMVRIQFFYMPWLYGLVFVILLKSQKFLKSITLIFFAFSVCYFSLQDMRWQKSFYFEEKLEISVWQDIIHRIKSNVSFNPGKKYDIFLIGSLNYRKMFNKKAKTKYDNYRNYYIAGSYSDIHYRDIFDFYEQKSYVRYVYDFSSKKVQNKMLDSSYLLTKAKPYPHPNSVYVNEKSIYIVLDGVQLDKIKRKLHSER